MPVVVRDPVVARGENRAPVDLKRRAIGREFVRRRIGPIVHQRADTHPAKNLHRLSSRKFTSLGRIAHANHVWIVTASDHGAAAIGRDGHALDGRGDAIGDGETMQQRIDRHIVGVAQLEVQMGRTGAALAAPGDDLAGPNRHCALVEIEVHTIAPALPLRLQHARGDLGGEAVEMGVDSGATVRQLLVNGPPITPGRGPDPPDVAVGASLDLVAGLAPGLDVYPSVEGGGARFAEGRRERRIEPQRPDKGSLCCRTRRRQDDPGQPCDIKRSSLHISAVRCNRARLRESAAAPRSRNPY